MRGNQKDHCILEHEGQRILLRSAKNNEALLQENWSRAVTSNYIYFSLNVNDVL